MADRYKTALAAVLAALSLASCGSAETGSPAKSTTAEAMSEMTNTASAAPAAAATVAETDTAPAETAAAAPVPEDNTVPPDYTVGEGSPRFYDTAPIIEAYKRGDCTSLDEKATAILGKAAVIIDEIITEDMSDYDKELAIHDYIIHNCTYDKGALAVISNPSPDSDNPYGALINGSAICSGYATTFRLFMGMLDIPCETVYHCASFPDTDHAWNIVSLDGARYYVDVTWDDPVPDDDTRLTHREYFNVSREFLEQDHTLSDECPDTPVMKDSYAEHNKSSVPEDDAKLGKLIRQAVRHDRNLVFIPVTEDSPWTEWMNGSDSDRIKYINTMDRIKKCANKNNCTVQAISIADAADGKVLAIRIKKMPGSSKGEDTTT